ncbi:MAG: hypothetical protein JWR37_522 [Mycobacterium sp.]|nr:hypothetical protein [Mycobacterium sp.]
MAARVDAAPSVPRWRVASGGHPLVACTADALEVAGTAAVSPVSGPAEPAAFIARDHDRWLADRVGRAKAGSSTVIMLTSDSTAGKKRSLWEAIRGTRADGQLQLAGWTVWPTLSPSDPATLLEAIPDLGPQTIVWLAGAERYFITAGPDVVDAIGKKLRELVTDEAHAPILLVGTLKQQHWNTLVAQPRDTASDVYCHIRHVLAGSAIVVPDSFTPSQIQRAAESADPRLARAARMAPHGDIVQYLAAEPDLKTRLHTSSSVAKAILRCAMEIRGLGHDQWIPSALLKEATGPRLTEREWHNVSDGWFDDAMAELTRTGRGDASPLIRRKIRGDAQNIDQPEYRLHDYFDKRAADTVCAPNRPAQAVWDALLKHAHSRSLLVLAREAHRRGLLHLSVSLYLAAADKNGPSCLAEPADALHTAGRIDEAVYCYRRAAECGDDMQIIKAGRILLWAGRGREAAELLRDLAQPDDPRALAVIAAAATSREDQRAAISAYQRAGEQGDSDALAVAASLLAEDGRLDEALRWLVSQSRSGCREALSVAATELVDTRSVEEAVNWLEAIV